ncbi:hypothetical protein [Prauserella cavernicola]|uniref:Uncharacterized protein n=1 Tax=Prauserella cavernicola TaxID=2800127 RepID=A0A934QNZ9_9PSEU|nr:hypothetical protein [Prauserella cavernicola]MBK1783482.1 hypothetical protein [Prauserella cavernicola]
MAAAGVLGAGFWAGYKQAGDEERATTVTNAGGEPVQGRANGGPTEPEGKPAANSAPEDVAGEWLKEQQSLYADDTRPDSWLSRIEGLSTQTMQSALSQFRDGNGGAAWENFQDQQCNRTLRDLRTEPADRETGDDSSTWVRARGVAVTECAYRPENPPLPAETPVTATLELTREDSGEWLVNTRIEQA